jgi:hypothetical protein
MVCFEKWDSGLRQAAVASFSGFLKYPGGNFSTGILGKGDPLQLCDRQQRRERSGIRRSWAVACRGANQRRLLTRDNEYNNRADYAILDSSKSMDESQRIA